MNRESDLFADDEGAGYLVSVSDIMAGLLFIFIITLVAFVIQFQDAAEKKEVERETLADQVEQLRNNREVRSMLLNDVKERLNELGVEVQADLQLGILRLTEQTVRFRTNKDILDETPRRNLEKIASVLAEVVPCYASPMPGITDHCASETLDRLEAVFIEGHTDNVPAPNDPDFNWRLSSKRAIATYRHMTSHNEVLSALRNTDAQPLFSVAGYAEQRPLHAHATPTDDERNRRIDIRFIMRPPAETAEIIKSINDQGVR